ncbi:hypothetical protein [Promicromonospora sp. NPDC023987]|uniref:HAAS signaling domain-containing protein n=1 Tax=Promicromonospora sp. NPDC023987 TaxID=3155360 RepID=UPI0033EC66BC
MTERTAMNANTEGAYLRDVGKRLRALTPEQRDAVLDDVRAHFADAADAGRTPQQAAESLGDPAQFTARVRAELGHEPGRTDRIWRILQWLATGVAVFTVMFVTFLLPDSGEDLDEPGFEIVLLHLIPVLIAALPLFVPARARRITTTAVAVVLTVGSQAVFESMDLYFFLPTAMLTWAALIMPIIARNGRLAVGWRITGAVIAALPGVWLVVSVLVGSFTTDLWGVLWIAISFGLAGLITVGRTWAGIVLAVAGAALLILSPLDPGMLVLAFWSAGGLLLTVGASHALVYARPRKPART